MEADERYRFTLDGQLATLDDYLEIRPEGEARIRALVEGGRLAIGPWQILMDEFLVSGETIVRNLERGLLRGEDFGGAMRVGYLPDQFGHVAQMPQILRQAGIEQAVVWRGVPAAIESHTFEWEAPDGSSVRTEYLPHGYGNGASLLDVPGRLADRLEAVHESLRPYFGEDPMLAMYGTDHTEPLPELAGLVEESGAAVVLSTLPDYLRTSNGEAQRPVWRGELRSGARANMLMGTISARIDLKAAMARAERMLTRYAEPLQALYGSAWPDRLLDIAWRQVLENSAHDSICGCSTDDVSAQVLVRCAEAEQIGAGLAREAVGSIAERVERDSTVVVNPSPGRRSDLVELDLSIPEDWNDVALELPDGALIATQELKRNEPLVHREEVLGAGVGEWLRRRMHGRELFTRRLNGFELGERSLRLEVDDEDDPAWLDVDELRSEIHVATAASPDEPWTVEIVAQPRRTLVARVPAPALGWTTVRPVEAAATIDHAVRVGERELRNGLLALIVAEDGTLGLNGVEGVGRLAHGGDGGDSYNYAPPEADRIIDEPDAVRVDVGAVGPLRGELRVVRLYRWPAPVEVTTSIELRAGEPFCRVRVGFYNPCDDHRIRFHIPLAETTDHSSAEGQFAVVERELEAEAGFGEVALPTFPAYGFVDAGGLAVLLDHVLEYELLEGRELALTLLRSTGLISRSAHAYRESPAGPEVEIPAAQCRGPWSVGFAVYPHGGDWQEARVLERLEEYRHPFLTTRGKGAESGPRDGAGPELRGDGVVLSSLRRREGSIEARVVCEQSRPVSAGFGDDEFDLRPWEIRTLTLGG